MWGIKFTTASNAGFITGLNVVFVPLFSVLFFGDHPKVASIVGVLLATAGLYLLSGGDFAQLNKGDWLVFICAITVTFHVILTGKYAPQHNIYVLTAIQLLTTALFSLIFTIARPGDNVVTSLNIFGEGYKQAAAIFPERCQVEFRFVDNPADLGSWESQLDQRTKLVWVETPSNACLFITDIAGVADVAHAEGIPLLVDNTTATAALQQPMTLGADIILLSITKFLAGNATVIGGAIIGEEALVEDIRWNTTEFIGSIMPP